MPPYEFRDANELVSELRQRKTVLAQWFEHRESSLESIARGSVQGNTFRAFRNMAQKPSVVFRTWALKQLTNELTIDQLTDIRTHAEYDDWLKEFSSSLNRHWKREMDVSMPYGARRKLPNLLLKALLRWDELDDRQRRRVIGYLHVPLDQYTLLGIKNCVSDFPESRVIGIIRSNVTMNFITNERMYNSIQHVVRKIAKRATVPAIYLDILAWNLNHFKR